SASAIIMDTDLCTFFEEALKLQDNAQEIANLVVNDLRRELAAAGKEGEGPLPLKDAAIRPSHIAELVALVENGTISKQIARDLMPEVFATGESPAAIVEKKGLKQTSDTGELEKLARDAIA